MTAQGVRSSLVSACEVSGVAAEPAFGVPSAPFEVLASNVHGQSCGYRGVQLLLPVCLVFLRSCVDTLLSFSSCPRQRMSETVLCTRVEEYNTSLKSAI